MVEKYAEGLDVRFGHKVEQIRWGADGVTVACSNGVELQADAVIVTFSLGILKVRFHAFFCCNSGEMVFGAMSVCWAAGCFCLLGLG